MQSGNGPETVKTLVEENNAIEREEFFKTKEIQVTCFLSWCINLPNGQRKTLPIHSVTVEIGYPQPCQSYSPGHEPAFSFRTSGTRINVGGKREEQMTLANWTKDNTRSAMSFTIPFSTHPPVGWQEGEFELRTTWVFNSGNPNLLLRSGGSVMTTSQRMVEALVRIIDPPLQSLVIPLGLDRPINSDLIRVEVEITLDDRVETLLFDKTKQRVLFERHTDFPVIWNHFFYRIKVTILGREMTDTPIEYESSERIEVVLPSGRLKILPCDLRLPSPPSQMIAGINARLRA